MSQGRFLLDAPSTNDKPGVKELESARPIQWHSECRQAKYDGFINHARRAVAINHRHGVNQSRKKFSWFRECLLQQLHQQLFSSKIY